MHCHIVDKNILAKEELGKHPYFICNNMVSLMLHLKIFFISSKETHVHSIKSRAVLGRLGGKASTLLPYSRFHSPEALTSNSFSCFSTVYLHFSKSAVPT